jgi:class 3 adenylate cyclase
VYRVLLRDRCARRLLERPEREPQDTLSRPRENQSDMSDLPSGTVSFLFTDIEGSTRLLQELGDGYAEALAEHRRSLLSPPSVR